jgi:hypothetical protein
MDLNKAILYAQLVNEAYATPPNNLGNRAGDVVSAGLGAAKTSYVVITTIYANDLATQKNPARGQNQVSIGLVLQEQGGGEAVIAFRGTEGIKEWVIDANFGTKACPFLASAGQTEDGFTDMYESVAIGTDAGSPSLTSGLPNLQWKQRVETLTVCGHSLGGALATLATLDIAVNSTAPFHDPTLYSYASPRTGDVQFATKYNQIVSNTFRVANDLDIVPQLPLFPPYEHVLGVFALKPFSVFPPKFLIQPNPLCEHILTSYLYLLSLSAGGDPLPPANACQPTLTFTALTQEFQVKWSDLDKLKQEFSASPGLR